MIQRLMKTWVLSLVVSAGVGVSIDASASVRTKAGSCLPESTSLQHFQILDLDRETQSRHSLKTTLDGVSVTTQAHVDLHYAPDSGRELSMTFGFDEDFEGVSLPFNVYAVLIVADGEVVAYHDFTASCIEPGISFFPGQTIRVPGAKFTGEGKRRLQLSVWARQ